ncbi:HPP family protein [Ectocarpus siliculosus]|uniref:HPP family protein n=1 Tax=Ectocarpus siliculosus TaxID=2880 RepID=D8LQ49_ECTSI|nr:HPP family protein [Ectocarpus siliculosus]|eukprot:CBN77429.1 HPP family protein [Ectocarpus siliculosus]
MENCHAGIVAALGTEREDPDSQEAGDVAYDHKEAICLDLSRAAGVAAVPLRGAGTPTASSSDWRNETVRETVTQAGGTRMDTSSNNNDVGAVPTTRDNIMDMSVRGQEDIKRFSAAVAATAADSTTLAPSSAGLLPRRKAPITPAVRYLMEAMCVDLVACGECFVPHFRARHTLVRFCGFIPPEVREGLDKQTRRFMGGEDVCDAVDGNVTGGEAYGRGIGLPGIAWATARATLVELSTLTSDASFDCGGVRLAQAGKIFQTALAIPIYFATNPTNTGSTLWGQQQQLMGVVVIYFRGPKNASSASALVRYASAVAKSAGPISELMVHRARFVVGRSHRIKRNWRVLIIGLRFAMLMLVRYRQRTGKAATPLTKSVDDAASQSLGGGYDGTATTSTPRFSFTRGTTRPSAGEMSASRRTHRVETSERAVMVVGQVQDRTKQTILPSKEELTKAWVHQYLAKAKGGPVNLPARASPRDGFFTWFGTFAAIGSLQLIYDRINQSSLWETQMVVVSIFEEGQAVWLQKSVSVASVILGMSLTGSVHPPAGALCLVLLSAYNDGATWERMLLLVVSVAMGLGMHLLVGICINNISPRRGYPAFW